MIRGVKDETTSLGLQLADRETTKFPQVEIFIPGSATPFVTVDLPHRSGGYYEASYTFTAVGKYNARFVTYTDAGHTTLDEYISTELETVLVEANDLDSIRTAVDTVTGDVTSLLTLLQRVLGLVQENFRIFSPVYDARHNLTSATIRIYPSKADTIANTNVLAEYSVSATYNVDDEMLTYQVVKE